MSVDFQNEELIKRVLLHGKYVTQDDLTEAEKCAKEELLEPFTMVLDYGRRRIAFVPREE